MNQCLILDYEGQKIAVVRNTYERAVFHYMHSLDWIGFDNWLSGNYLLNQTKLYKDCDHFISFEDWEDELKLLNLHPKDTSVMEGQKRISDWKQWYTLKSIQLVNQLYSDELKRYGYSY